MIARKLFSPESLAGSIRLRFDDHTLLVQSIAEPYVTSAHIPGPGIVTCLSGSGRFILNGESQLIDDTRYLITDASSRLSIRMTHPDAQPLLLFFQSDLAAKALARHGAELCWLERAHPMTVLLRERLTWLVRLGNNCSSFSALKADAMIGDMLRELVHDATAAAVTAAKIRVSRQSTRVQLYRRLSLAREWIDCHYGTPLPLDVLAGQAALNRQHFLRMFRDCYGLTPHQYLTEVRLTAARQLLIETAQPVTAICRLTGFESLSSFSGLFRMRFGASPKAWRDTQSRIATVRR